MVRIPATPFLIIIICVFNNCILFAGECRPTLEELCRHITPEHAANWRKIGIELGVFYTDLNAIEQVYSGLHEICCNEMFEKWLQNQPQATWNDVFKAVGIESWYDNPDRYHQLTG